MSAIPTVYPGQLLTEILTWCAEHPWTGGDLTPGDITFQQHYNEADDTRTVSIMGTPPEIMAVSVALLDQADPQLLRFERGLLVLDVQPESVLYEPLYVSRRDGLFDAVVFGRARFATPAARTWKGGGCEASS